MSQCTEDLKVTPPDDWVGLVEFHICNEWAAQALPPDVDFILGIAHLIERRRDFEARVHAVADMILEVAPLLSRWPVRRAEYVAYLRVPLDWELPFLEEEFRIPVALTLIAELVMPGYDPIDDFRLDP